ncbi:GH1 family beta-glucosidase [Arundinibacter roseus]|uniref:Beta-glucosidase n=1 Tax=Arundinibacter roseus TaxID=2070510 RepID=A0A4R4KBM9_9BACT|nr:GH1 family beta-glucosidase [Arundinibacter roseus]TDB64162.1 beta-glucosidase [Arundinibacter roseus]
MELVDYTRANSFCADPEGVETTFTRNDFGKDFYWGTATSAFQIEGAAADYGRGPSIWDKFTKLPGKIKNNACATRACDHYHRYEEDLDLLKTLGFTSYRFSLSWSRIFPDGTGRINPEGVAFYHRLIDACHERGIEPWITLYHWDLPQALQDRGGWESRQILNWFAEYVSFCATEFGDIVKKWIVLNEPMAVAALGYTSGLHAPGRKGLHRFLPVVHHLALCQAEGGRLLRQLVPGAYVGTTFSCSPVLPHSPSPRDVRAAKRLDALLNRLFVEPTLGMGYPTDAFPFLKNIRYFMKPGDAEKLAFDFDFIGLQNYFQVVVRHSWKKPLLWAEEVKPTGTRTAMGWGVAPEGLYKILTQFGAYEGIKELIISENGAAFHDEIKNGEVHDPQRIGFFRDYLENVLRARQEGVPVNGYFAWSLLDNFEWAEGYDARFGLVHVDYATQKRTIKSSGYWFAEFLA